MFLKGITLTLSAAFIFGCSSSPSELFPGETKEGFFFPKPQAWKIVSFVVSDDAPTDLKGLPVIFGGSPFLFGENFFAMLDPNSGGFRTIGSCFKVTPTKLTAIPQGRFQRAYAAQAVFNIKNGRLHTKLDPYFQFTLAKAPEYEVTQKRLELYKRTVDKVTERYKVNWECGKS